jgi:hypothetical protein
MTYCLGLALSLHRFLKVPLAIHIKIQQTKVFCSSVCNFKWVTLSVDVLSLPKARLTVL